MSRIQYGCVAFLATIVWFLPVTICVAAEAMALWPAAGVAALLHEQPTLRENLRRRADMALRAPPAPVQFLSSAGITNKNTPALKASRRAFRDADNAAVAALAFAAFGETRYLSYVKRTLLRWAEVNVPTGHPIDETRLEGFLWAFDLIKLELNIQDKAAIENYFRALREAKRHWKFGPKTQYNNHKTHHLKMLILLDQILNDEKALAFDIAAARAHVQKNIDKATGVSLDYIERDALYYHMYNLEAWLEIALISNCCVDEVSSAFRFATEKLLSNDIEGEFLRSQAKIDKLRGQSGFAYAKRNSRYDVKRAARVLLSYSTVMNTALSAELRKLINSDSEVKLSFYFVRRQIWNES